MTWCNQTKDEQAILKNDGELRLGLLWLIKQDTQVLLMVVDGKYQMIYVNSKAAAWKRCQQNCICCRIKISNHTDVKGEHARAKRFTVHVKMAE